MRKSILGFIATAALSTASMADPIEFDLTDPKGVNNIVFLLDAPLESINGTATGISGTLSFDPDSPESTSGKMVVATNSMSVANPKMLDHIMGGKWMAAKKHPELTFDLSGISDVTNDGNKYSGTASGTMTIKGVSKEMEIPISLTFLEGKLAARQRVAGDIIVVRSSFSVLRSDFKVNSGAMEDKVADEVELRLSIAGFAPSK